MMLSTTTLSEARAYAAQRKAITDQLKTVLIDRLSLEREPDEIPEDCLLFGIGLALNSVDALEIVVAVEGEFGVKVTDSDMRELRSINSIVDFVLTRQSAEVFA